MIHRLPIELAIDYAFADRNHLGLALTHRSYAFEFGGAHNERLEFLGDSILNCCTTLLLMNHFPEVNEGELSRLRARLVNTETLAEVAIEIGIPQVIKLGRGESSTGGSHKTSILADTVEALLGAVYLDAGFEEAKQVVTRWMGPRMILLASSDDFWKDARSQLQELTQQHWKTTPDYEMISLAGPPHAPIFEMVVKVGDRELGRGIGSSKREASHAAAREGLIRLRAESS